MKKLILFFLPLFTVVSNAEELKFVTVLSSPVGSFNKLETVDPTSPAKSPAINFCTSIGTGGTIALKGASKPDVETMNLSQSTTLGRAGTGDYVLNKITMKNGGSLKGSRLLASTVQVDYQTAGKSDKLYTDTLTVAGAKAEKLNVNNGASKITEQHSDPGMMWSNQYKTDKACGDKCKDQYLLKQQGGVVEDNKVTCFTRIDWRTRMNNIDIVKKDWDEWLKDSHDWDVNKWWIEHVSPPNQNNKYGTTDSEGFTIEALWYDGGGDCSRCEYAKPCKCTPGKEYRLNTVLAKVLHVPDKWHVSQLEGWHVGICEETTPDKCLSWKGSDLGLAIGGVAWTKATGPVAPKTAGGGTVTNYEVETIEGVTMGVVPPDASYFAYCDYTN